MTRTPWIVFRNEQYNTGPPKLVSSLWCYINLWPYGFRSFDLPLRVLFSLRSRYYCTIGLETYLGLEVNASQIHARYPTHTTREHQKSPYPPSSKGLSPSMAWLSSQVWVFGLRCKRACNSTPPLPFGRDSDCPIPRSIAFNNGISVDFFSCGY